MPSVKLSGILVKPEATIAEIKALLSFESGL